jgi:hypothetical protein
MWSSTSNPPWTRRTTLPTCVPELAGQAYDIRWFAPTPANLALLTVPIPPGFTQVDPVG